MLKFLLLFSLIMIFIPSALSDIGNNKEQGSNSQQENQNSSNKTANQKTKRKPSKQEGRDEWFYHQRALPFERIPLGARKRALEYTRRMVEQ